MNRAELVEAMAAKTGDTKKATDEALRAFVDVVTDALVKGDKTSDTRNENDADNPRELIKKIEIKLLSRFLQRKAWE